MLGFKYLFLFISLYIYLYNPIFQIFGFGLIKVLLLISIIYLFFKGLQSKFFTLFKVEIIFTIVIIYYISLKSIGGDMFGITLAYIHFVWFLESFIIPVFLVLFFKEIYSKVSWEAVVVITGFAASLITLFLILNPEYNIIIRQNVIIDPLDLHTGSLIEFRGFSVAEGSTFGYGIIQGLILSVCLFNLRKSWLYGIPIVFLFLSVLLNARIGLSVIFSAILILVFYGRIRIISIVLLAIVIFAGYKMIFFLSETHQIGESLIWGFRFFDEIKFFSADGTEGSTLGILFEDMIFLPSDGIGLLFGEGRSVFYQYGKNSDVGYVNQIFAGGFIYLFMMLLFISWLFVRNYRLSANKILPVLFFFTLIIVNIKGDALLNSIGFSRIMTFYLVYCVFLEEGMVSENYSVSYDLQTNN